ncbi:caspase family protein [Actinocrispum wychmicini]|uniref:Caspase domain-containing protein n=1 Tax=Actinocrispum wychmicini TaxID=1213861 RepID=A0A4R2IXU4_9PSEU|nr:caspase family protein [Actinocrispum wychmicini]TCO49782.1 caspase domain-containing protein [Actinocrispum wychmicini]
MEARSETSEVTLVRLPDPERSCAVLIGVSSYRSTDLPNLPAVDNNLDALHTVLTDSTRSGFTANRCGIVDGTGSVRDVYRTLCEYAKRADDTFLVYFAGHGLTGSVRNELYLCLSDTDVDELPVSALSMDLLRDVFLNCQATNRVLVLDCCFSGRATQGVMTGDTEAVLGQIEVAGTYTLTSTPPNTPALARPGATYTAFTGELVALLRNGIPDGPELLSLATIYRRLRATMAARGLPLPSQRGTGTADHLALVRNPAHGLDVPDSVGFDVSPAPDITLPATTTRTRDRIVSVAVAGIAAASVIIIATNQDRGSRASGTTTPSQTPTTTSTSDSSTTSTRPYPTDTRLNPTDNKTLTKVDPAALDCADKWARAFVNHTAGITKKQWLDGLSPYTTEEYQAITLTRIDLSAIIMTRVTGKPTATPDSYINSVTVDVPTDGGKKLRLTLIKTSDGWRVNEHGEVS